MVARVGFDCVMLEKGPVLYYGVIIIIKTVSLPQTDTVIYKDV